MESHKKERIYSCQHCDSFFISKKDLDKHAKNHTTKNKFYCDTCGNAFKTNKILSAHRKKHSAEILVDTNTFISDKCESSFSPKKDFLKHMESHKEQQIQIHRDEYHLHCDICHKTFKTKLGRYQHRQICFRGIKLWNQSGENNCYVNVCINSLASVTTITDTIMTSPSSEIIDIFKNVILTEGPHNIRILKTI